eukprot:3562534-Pyramimonas_sp.AAC.1
MPIGHVDLVMAKADELARGELPDLFAALLGAAAYALLAQHRVAACVVAARRAESKLLIRRVMQLSSA